MGFEYANIKVEDLMLLIPPYAFKPVEIYYQAAEQPMGLDNCRGMKEKQINIIRQIIRQ